MAEYIGITQYDLPTVHILDTRGDFRKYKLIGDITLNNLINFVSEWENGELVAFYKSQEIPHYQTGPIKEIVGKNFKEVVFDESRDILVEFYAPWCNYCMAFVPVYLDLAEKLERLRSEILLTRIDIINNEVEGIIIQGTPTLMFYKKGSKNQPIVYSGERELNKILDFLEVKELKDDL